MQKAPARLDLKSPVQSLRLLLNDRNYFWYLATLALVGDTLLTQLVIRFISYTEIDFTTYMRQVEVYQSGERDYSLLKGPSGPLVYPAGHLLVHRFLHTVTSGGANLALTQQIYGALYLISQFLTMAIYKESGEIPNWAVLLLPLSKRLHSIYVLRMFNEAWAIPTVLASILLFCRGEDALASLLFSAALSVKMNILLYLPGLLVVLVKSRGLELSILNIITMIAFQIFIAAPFLLTFPSQYFYNAFEFRRTFLYEWTVNWRFVPEVDFLSRRFALALLGLHLGTLVAFGLGKWCSKDGGAFNVIGRAFRGSNRPAGLNQVTSDEIITVLFTSNLIGIIFARSLHYQFYSWYAQQLPFLVFRTKYPIVLKLALLFAIEYAWNVFPSTNVSSGVLLASNLAVLVGVWFGFPVGVREPKPLSKTE